jgi:antitoxin CcdA
MHTASHATPYAASLSPSDTQKRPVNLSINVRTLEMAKELGMNLSKTVDAFLQEEVKRRYWEKWRDDNREGFEAYNERIKKDGLPLAKYRTWGKSLGDGRINEA